MPETDLKFVISQSAVYILYVHITLGFFLQGFS